MSLSSLGSLASTAFDTARSTFKAMAEAAVPPATDGGAATRPTPAPPAAADTPTPAVSASTATFAAEPTATTPRQVKGRRLGTVLDAYA
jgi:hypothetical protein